MERVIWRTSANVRPSSSLSYSSRSIKHTFVTSESDRDQGMKDEQHHLPTVPTVPLHFVAVAIPPVTKLRVIRITPAVRQPSEEIVFKILGFLIVTVRLKNKFHAMRVIEFLFKVGKHFKQGSFLP